MNSEYQTPHQDHPRSTITFLEFLKNTCSPDKRLEYN